MSGLPEGWVEAPIGELCTLNNGRAFKPTEWENEGLPIVRIQNLNNPDAKFNYFNGAAEERYSLKGGELLFAWSGTPGTSFGAHIWRGGSGVLNQHIFRVDFSSKHLDRHYFKVAINHRLEELIGVAHGGVGLRHVTKGTFESTSILLPSLAEQKVIAHRLDALLAQVDTLQSRLDAIPVILKRFRKSVLSAAVNGKLTEEWRIDQKQKWKSTLLGDICQSTRIITYGVIKLGDEDLRGIPCLRTSNVGLPRYQWISLGKPGGDSGLPDGTGRLV